MTPTSIESIRPSAARQQLASSDRFILLDVREHFELELARVADALHIPLGQLLASPPSLPADKTIYCLCHHGVRSAHAARFLLMHGYQAVNVTGGIDLWSMEADPVVPRY